MSSEIKHTATCKGNQPFCNYEALHINPGIELKNWKGSNERNSYDDPIIIKCYSSNLKGVMAQFMVTGAVFILTVGCGMLSLYTLILYSESLIGNEMDWKSLVHGLATPIGALASGALTDFIGRRGCLQMASFLLCLSWMVRGLSEYTGQKFLGSIPLWFAFGFIRAPSLVILAEMSDPRLRGMLLGGTVSWYLVAQYLFYYLSAQVPWESFGFYIIIIIICGFVALCLVYESPVWLIRQKKTEAAKKALLWLRGGDKAQVNKEVAILEARANSDLAWKLNLTLMIPLIIINVFNFFVLFSRNMFILTDTHSLYTYTSNYFMVTSFVVYICACVLLLVVNRRTLILLSELGTGLILLILASYYFFQQKNQCDICITACFTIYVAMSTGGSMFSYGIIVGELLPQRARGWGVGFTLFLAYVIPFAINQFHERLLYSNKTPAILLVCGTLALINVIFIFFFLPETKDQTLQEIEDYFQNESIFWMRRKKEHKQAEPVN